MTPSSGCNANALFQLCSGLFAIAPDCTKNGKGKAESSKRTMETDEFSGFHQSRSETSYYFD